MKRTRFFLGFLALVAWTGCGTGEPPADQISTVGNVVDEEPVVEVVDTCQGPYRSFWDDPANTPPADAPHVFRLSQAFPKALPDIDAEPWKAFSPWTAETLEERGEESDKYIHAILDYIFEGNISDPPAATDFDLCTNAVRPWFHVPWMDANPSKGREYVRGLTRELSPSSQKLSEEQEFRENAWAVGFYNARGAFAIGKIFPGTAEDAVDVPTTAVDFPTGSVVGKALFTSALPSEVAYLEGAPTWQANVMPPPCGGKFTGTATDPRTGEEVECKRRLQDMRLAQFDVAVVDERSPLGWVFGTFIYNGLNDSTRGWRGLEPAGLMWANDPDLEPSGTKPGAQDPAERGLTPPENVQDSYMFTSTFPPWLKKDIGCAGRLDGPIDNPRSSCMSCHASASVPLVIQAGEKNPCRGTNVSRTSVVKAPILGSFFKQCGDEDIDKVWFRDIKSGEPLDDPSICEGQNWVTLDYSLQLSEGLTNYMLAHMTGVQDAHIMSTAPVFPEEHMETAR